MTPNELKNKFIDTYKNQNHKDALKELREKSR